MDFNKVYEKELSFQADRRKATVEFINIVSDLWYDKSIELVLFRNQLINRNVSDILDLHEYAGEFVGKPISIFDSVEIATAIKDLNLPPAKLDIGKLTYEYHLDGSLTAMPWLLFLINLATPNKQRLLPQKMWCFMVLDVLEGW